MIRRSFVKSISALSISPFFSWVNIVSWFKGAETVKDAVKEIIAIVNTDEPGFQLHWENPIPILDAGPPKTPENNVSRCVVGPSIFYFYPTPPVSKVTTI